MDLPELMKAAASQAVAPVNLTSVVSRSNELRRSRLVLIAVSAVVVVLGGVAAAQSLMTDEPVMFPVEGSSPTPSPGGGSGEQSFTDEENGFTVTYPDDWHRAEESLTPNLADPIELFSVSSIPLVYQETDCSHMPTGALEEMGDSDVFVSVQERGGRDGKRDNYPPRPADFSKDAEPSMLACIPEDLVANWIPFSDGGRRFYALVAFGHEAPTEDREGAWAVLNGVRFQPTEGSHVGFVPPSRTEDGQTLMPVTFVDGSKGEIVADKSLRVDRMAAQIYTAGGLGGVDRTINFSYGVADAMMHEGPLESYEGPGGSPVEVWEPAPDTYLCPNLVHRFGGWFVGVRTCQNELSVAQKRTWARSLEGRITEDGFLVLSARSPLSLQVTGGHEGPEMILNQGRSNWIEMEPGPCSPDRLPDEADMRTMSDGTLVSFSRIGGENSKMKNSWFATWCEDGSVLVQVSQASKAFAEAAAEGFRMRDIALAD